MQIAPRSDFQEKYLNCNADIIIAGGAMGCVPAETEFLSPSGWKKISEWVEGDKVASVKVDTNDSQNISVGFKKPNRFIKIPCDEMNFIESGDFRQTLSTEHRVIAWNEDGECNILPFSNLLSNLIDGNCEYSGIRTSVNYNTNRGIKLKDGDIKSIVDDSMNDCLIFPKSFWNISFMQCLFVLDSLMGFVKHGKNNCLQFQTKYKNNADFIQYVLVCLNITSNISCDGEHYTLSFNVDGPNTVDISKDYIIGKSTTTDGFKYCFEVDTGFLLLRENGRIFITGNSSKSYIGLMRHLRWVDDPNYRGYCIRKNSTTLMKSGGLFEEAYEMYKSSCPGVKIRLKDQKIIFPSGASVSFSHYESSRSSEIYRGLQLSSVFYDEGTDANEEDIWFLISRLRTKAKMSPSIWITCNPTPFSYLRRWVDWWLYPQGHPKAGLPDPKKNGVMRWMVRLSGEIYWGDSKEELIKKYGIKKYPVDHLHQIKPKSFTCLFGTIWDNPVLLETNPGYLASLEAQPEVEKQRNLYGSWDAVPVGNRYFERDWVEEISDFDSSDVVDTVRTFDFASSLKSDVYRNPDYTATVKMHKMKDGTYVISDVQRTRIRPGDWFKFVVDSALGDTSDTVYYIPQDPGASAKRAVLMFCRELSEHGLYVKRMSTQQSKLERFRPFSSMAQNGGIKILKGCGVDHENNINYDNSFIYKELETFTGARNRTKDGHDDNLPYRQ